MGFDTLQLAILKRNLEEMKHRVGSDTPESIHASFNNPIDEEDALLMNACYNNAMADYEGMVQAQEDLDNYLNQFEDLSLYSCNPKDIIA